MVDEFDSDNASKDTARVMEKRIQEYESIISQLKKQHPESVELKLCNDTSIHLEEVGGD